VARHLPVPAAAEPKGVPALRRTTPAPSTCRPGVAQARWRITPSTSRSSARRGVFAAAAPCGRRRSPGSSRRFRTSRPTTPRNKANAHYKGTKQTFACLDPKYLKDLGQTQPGLTGSARDRERPTTGRGRFRRLRLCCAAR
jgi:hypothetical protein